MSAVAGAIAGVIGSAITAGVNSGQASITRKWAEHMRATAYQATMKDMRKAGLNPILVSRSNPTTAPSGAMAVAPDFGQAMSAGLGSGTSAKGVALKDEKVKHEIDLLNSQRMQADATQHNQQAQATKQIYENRGNQSRAEFDAANPRLIKENRRAELIGGAAQSYLGPITNAIGAGRR